MIAAFMADLAEVVGSMTKITVMPPPFSPFQLHEQRDREGSQREAQRRNVGLANGMPLRDRPRISPLT